MRRKQQNKRSLYGGNIVNKGTYGYIKYKKRHQLIITVATYMISLTVLLVGYLLYQSNQSVFTVLAILIVLPASKYFTGYIIIAPFHSVDRTVYNQVKEKSKENDFLFTDLVLTSPEKVMNLSFLMIKGDKLFGLCEHKKSNDKYIQEYLQKLIDDRMLSFRVKIEKEYKTFLKDVEQDSKQLAKDSDLEELKKLIISLLV